MKVLYKGMEILCTPGEYMELLQKGAFNDGNLTVGKDTTQLEPVQVPETTRDWLKRGMGPDVVAVYGCQYPSLTSNVTLTGAGTGVNPSIETQYQDFMDTLKPSDGEAKYLEAGKQEATDET
jgi:hypothetical protein